PLPPLPPANPLVSGRGAIVPPLPPAPPPPNACKLPVVMVLPNMVMGAALPPAPPVPTVNEKPGSPDVLMLAVETVPNVTAVLILTELAGTKILPGTEMD